MEETAQAWAPDSGSGPRAHPPTPLLTGVGLLTEPGGAGRDKEKQQPLVPCWCGCPAPSSPHPDIPLSSQALTWQRCEDSEVAGLERGTRQPLALLCETRGGACLWGALPESEWRLAVRLLHAVEEAAEELVPEEHQAGGEGGLQQAGGQALEAARGPLLPQHLPRAVQEASVAPHLWEEG